MSNENGPQPSDLSSLPLFQDPAQAPAAPAPAKQAPSAASHLLNATRASRRNDNTPTADDLTDRDTLPPEVRDNLGQRIPFQELTGERTMAWASSPAAAEELPAIATAPARSGDLRRGSRRSAVEAFEDQGFIPWEKVSEFRDQVSKTLSDIEQVNQNLTPEDRERLAREHTTELITMHVDEQTRRGDEVWSPALREDIVEAVFNAMFRLGRLQPLVDIEGVENIDIVGYDNVWISVDGGERQRFPHPISTSNEELQREINFIASRRGEGGRTFNSARPTLHLDLAGGARLAANAMPIVDVPSITIRIHRHRDVSLDQLAEGGTMPRNAANFLRHAVRAGLSIVTNGYQSSGKTTLLRALADEIPPLEKISTIEMERELQLHLNRQKHPLVVPFEYRPGEGEPGVNGSQTGEYTLIMGVNDSLRHTTDRIIVGEVRGPEINAMLQAMQSGIGSMSTLHSASPQDAIERMVTLMMRDGSNVTPAYAYRQISQTIDLIVQMARIKDPETGKTRRVCTSISQVRQGGDGLEVERPEIAEIFKWDKTQGHLVLGELPHHDILERLVDFGYDQDELMINGGRG